MRKVARMAVDNTAFSFDQLFDYRIPEQFLGQIQPGCRVMVPFGVNNQKRLGLVFELLEDDDKPLKTILEVVDTAPILSQEGLVMVRYLKQTTFCTYFDALRTILPTGIGVDIRYQYQLGAKTDFACNEIQAQMVEYLQKKKKVDEKTFLQLFPFEKELAPLVAQGVILKTELLKRKIMDEKVVMVRLTENIPAKVTPKQKKVIEVLDSVETASLKEICYLAAVGKSVVDRLKQAGAVEYYENEVFRNPYADKTVVEETVVLSQQQQQAYEQLLTDYEKKTYQVTLLHGVTGSGKTNVFLTLIQRVLQDNKSVMVLVPEISLTPQTIGKFRAHFGQQVAVLHSGLTLAQRLDEWKRIKQQKASVVVGTRSAVFAPLENLGLIVIDEEQEHTYKSDRTPRYHAREIAKLRCQQNNAMLLLSSATPSVESYYYATLNRYHLVSLQQRYGNAQLPPVYIIDMKDHAITGNTTVFSEELLDEIAWNLDHKEQSILLLNRRGHSTLVRCSGCQTVIECPHCSVAMTYHAANDSLVCHYCGHIAPIPKVCSHCGSQIVTYTGVGTQKAEEQLQLLFPKAKILRMDMDTTITRFSHERRFAAFAKGEYDIMIGTQMVAKGLDFPNVTLVGVINADQSLYSGNFRSFENTFDLLTQVVGRCGRGEKKGRALIQTYSPENRIIELASAQKYEDFFAEEIAYRKMQLYPPFCEIASIGFVGTEETLVKEGAFCFFRLLVDKIKSGYKNLPIRILGPTRPQVYKTAEKYHYQMLLKYKKGREINQLLSETLAFFSKEKVGKKVTAYIDPYYSGM